MLSKMKGIKAKKEEFWRWIPVIAFNCWEPPNRKNSEQVEKKAETIQCFAEQEKASEKENEHNR